LVALDLLRYRAPVIPFGNTLRGRDGDGPTSQGVPIPVIAGPISTHDLTSHRCPEHGARSRVHGAAAMRSS